MKRIRNRIEPAKNFFARYAREASRPPAGQLENPLSDARGVNGFTTVAPPSTCGDRVGRVERDILAHDGCTQHAGHVGGVA